MNENKKPPQDVRNQGEHKIGQMYYFDAFEIPLSEVSQRKTEILRFLGTPSIQGHLIIDIKCVVLERTMLFTVLHLINSL